VVAEMLANLVRVVLAAAPVQVGTVEPALAGIVAKVVSA
jgi:hypothetical protein